MNKYLHHFVTTRNTRALAALGGLALVFPFCRIDRFRRSFLSSAVRLWSLLHQGIIKGVSGQDSVRASGQCQGSHCSLKTTSGQCLGSQDKAA